MLITAETTAQQTLKSFLNHHQTNKDVLKDQGEIFIELATTISNLKVCYP